MAVQGKWPHSDVPTNDPVGGPGSVHGVEPVVEDAEDTEVIAVEDVLAVLPPSPQAPGHTGRVHPPKVSARMVT
jgi:hypothetical protein